MTDLTQITCPPGLLNDETFERLREWPHGWEWWDGFSWRPKMAGPSKNDVFPVRARPAPVVTERKIAFYATIRHTGDRLPIGTYTGPDGATITVEGEL